MKKILFILLFTECYVALNASDYLSSSLRWDIDLLVEDGISMTKTIRVAGDTIINEKTYRLVDNFYPMRQTSDSILMYDRDNKKEVLLYNFALQIGDSIELMADPFGAFPARFGKVVKTEIITLADGRKARKIEYEQNGIAPRSADIEYVGSSTSGILGPLNNVFSESRLISCYDNEALLYTNAPFIINGIEQVLNNVTPSPIVSSEWSGEWAIEEWQQIEYIPQAGDYTYMHKQEEHALLTTNENDNQGLLEFEGYSISLKDANSTVIDIVPQYVLNTYDSQDRVSGKMALVDKQLYIHLHIVGTQDYVVDIYGIGHEIPQHATTWRGVECVKYDAPNEDLSFISDVIYTLGGDTTIQLKHYSKLLFTYERGGLVNSYRGAIRQTSDGQKVYYVPSGKINGSANEKEYLLYDFTVTVGDVVKAYNGWEEISCVEFYGEDAITPEWTVTDVQVSNGRKHVYITNEDYGHKEWIEGVGTKNILWTQQRTCYPTGNESRMRRTLCALDSDGNSLYTFNTDDMGIINHCTSWEYVKTSVEQITADQSSHSPSSATKLLRDGQLFILRDGKTYTVTGQEVK